jgi:hypothetical protein
MNMFNPSPMAANAFNHTFNAIETTPQAGYAGSSHFSYCNPQCENPGWHSTTQLKGFGQAEGLSNGLRDHYHF